MIGSTTTRLLRLWWRRWRNRRVSVIGISSASIAGAKRRTGTAPRQRAFAPIAFFLITLVVMPFVQWSTVKQMQVHGTDLRLPIVEAPRTPSDRATSQALALLVLLMFVGVLCTELSQDALTEGGWDVEWLATLPVDLGELFRARLIARTFMSPLSFFWLWPLLVAIGVVAGPWWLAPITGTVLVLPLLLLRAAITVFLEALLHLRVSMARLRNVKGICAIVGTAALFSCFYARGVISGGFDGSGVGGRILEWLPTGLVVRAIREEGLLGLWAAVAAIAEVALATLFLIACTQALVKEGVVAGGSHESSRAAKPEVVTGRSYLSPFVRREFKLLARDFNYLSQALLVPLVFVGFQVLNARGDLTTRFDTLPAICAFAFAITAYTYLFSCLRALALEQDSLWMLATFPKPLDAALRAKSKAWSTLIAIYPTVVVAIGVRHLDVAAFKVSQLASLGMLALGVPMFAFLFTSLGVISGESVLGPEKRGRSSATQLVSVLLIALYTAVIANGDPWRSFGASVLTAALTIALWQKAADTLPYLLDPWSPIPRRVSLADGLAAVLLFFVFQGLFDLLLRFWTVPGAGERMFLSYAGAGLLACGLSFSGLWRFNEGSAGAGRVPKLFGPGAARSVALGLAAGVAVGAVGVAAQWLLVRAKVVTSADLDLFVDAGTRWWLGALALIAAPLFEEYLFRGLVFGGIERLWGFRRAALLSALVFTVVHPPLSCVPVFLLGLATALVYSRGGLLIGSIVAHLVYNACVVASVHWLHG